MPFYTSDPSAEVVREFLGGRYMDIMARRHHPSWIAGLATEFVASFNYATSDKHSLVFNSPNDGSYSYQAELFYARDPLEKYSMIPVFRGRVIRASSPSELRSHKQYKFLIDERADFTQW